MINKQSKLARILSSITLATALLFPLKARTEPLKLKYLHPVTESESQIPDYSWILREPNPQETQSEETGLGIKDIQDTYKTPEELQREKLDLIRKKALENVRTSVNESDFVRGLKYDLSELIEKNYESLNSDERQRLKFKLNIRNKGELYFRIQRELYYNWLGEIGTQADYSRVGGNVSLSKELKGKSRVSVSAGEEKQKGTFLKFDYRFSY
ncbi:hypothetical protein J4429_04885 [Candidatus Pacearchaeota archaeon]|nr:hypothetical protein [Candidatus Pacearchaeota archaeon]